MADDDAKCEGSEIESNGSSVTIEGTPPAKENKMYDSEDERAKNRELFTAIYKGDSNMVKLLLGGGVRIDIVDKNNKENTPLHYAVERKKKDIVEELLNPRWGAGIAYVNTKNNKKKTAMHIAISLHCQDIVKILDSFIQSKQQVSVVAKPASQKKLQENFNFESYDGQKYNAQSSNQLRKPKNDPEKHQKFTFSKRPGTTIDLDGHFYEIDLIILGRLRGDRDTDKFYLTSNKPGVGAFDDVVIRYWEKYSEMKPTIIFLQAKHVTSKIIFENFTNPGNDNKNFYLPKYFSSFLDIRDMLDGKSDDPIFDGNFRELDVRFVIYTTASLDEKFDKDRIESIEDRNIFSTNSESKPFKITVLGDKNSDLIEELGKVCLQNRIKLLAEAFVTHILRRRNYINMMRVEILSTYRVVISKNVVNVGTERLKDEKGVEYREGKINYLFLENKNEDPFKEELRKEILYEYTKKEIYRKKAKLGDNNEQNDLVRLLAESLKSPENVDYNIIRKLCGSVIIMHKDERKLIFSNPKKLKDEDAVNFINKLKNEIGDLASYKFDISYELIKQDLNKQIEEKPLKLHINFGNIDLNLENKKNRLDIDDIGDYKFDIKVTNFPRDSLIIEERDRADVKEFLSKLEFFVDQANDEKLKKIINIEMTDLFKLTEKEAEDSFLKIRNKAEKFWGSKRGYYLKKDDDFFSDMVKFNIKFHVNQPIPFFTGRVSERKELHTALQKNHSVVLAGLGGTGKSELVRKYVSEHSDDYHGNIIWINAQNYRARVKSFTRLARDKLGIIVQISEKEQKDIKSIVEDVYGFFAKRKSLFIFDNAEKLGMPKDLEGICDFLPSSTSNENKPYVIITSRYQDWENNRKLISLGSFESKDAMNFIRKALNIIDASQEKSIQKLAEKLQYFPLTLHQAVACIKLSDEKRKIVNLNNRFTIDDYLQEYEKNVKGCLAFKFSENSGNEYAETTMTTWLTTIDKIKEDEECGGKALEILNIIAYFVPYNIPVKMFSKIEKDDSKLAAAVLLLKNYSMVALEGDTLTVHRLVQEVTRIRYEVNEKITLSNALLLFNDGITKNDLCDEDDRLIAVEHAMSVWSYATKYPDLDNALGYIPDFIAYELVLHFKFEICNAKKWRIINLINQIN